MDQSDKIDKLLGELIENHNNIQQLQILIPKLRNKKKQSQKVALHVQTKLQNLQVQLKYSLKIILNLFQFLKKNRITENFQASLFEGFIRFWKYLQINNNKEQKIQALKNYQQIADSILLPFLKFFYEKQFVTAEMDEILKYLNKLLQEKNPIRALKLIKGLQLQYNEQLLVQQLTAIQFQAQQIKFFLADNVSFQKKLIKKLKYNQKLAINIIKLLNLDPNQFEDLLWELTKKSYNHFLREDPLYVSQLKYSQNHKSLAHLIIYLFQNRQHKYARSLLKKYDLYDYPYFYSEKYQDQIIQAKKLKNQTSVLKNILIEKDYFGATELRVLGEPRNYIQLIDFGIKQKDVEFIDSVQGINFKQACDHLTDSNYISFDCQFNISAHTFEEQRIEIMQISSQSKIYIFDFNKLKKFPDFRDLIKDLFVDNLNYLIGHGSTSDIKLIKKQFNFDKYKTIVDTQDLFNKKNNKKLNIGLAQLTKQIFNKELSKFQQCSSWRNRPLRKAQLHYAALDAFLLLKIYSKLIRN